MEMDAEDTPGATNGDDPGSLSLEYLYHLAHSGNEEIKACNQQDLGRMITCRVDTFVMACGEFLEGYVDPENENIARSWLSEGSCSCVKTNPIIETAEAGVTLLHIAAAQGHTWLVCFLLERVPGIIHVKTLYTEQTALHMAISSENPPPLELIQSLLDAGVDVEERDGHIGYTALFRAVKLNHPFLIPVLASAGCPVDAENLDHTTPLSSAINTENLECVHELMKAGADATQSRSFWNPISFAIQKNNLELAKLLLSGKCDINVQGYRGTPLHHAVQHGSEQFAELLLEAGADPNIQNEDSHTPLMVAAYNNNQTIARMLMARGANVNLATDNGYMALHLASWDGHFDIVQMLMAAGSLHDQRTDDLNTPLALACHGNWLKVIECLLPAGCNVNNADKDADTPMHYVAYNGCLESLNLLLSYGANPDVENHHQTTPLWNAVWMKHTSLVHELLLCNVRPNVVSRGIDQTSRTDLAVLIYTRPRSPLFVACDVRCFDIAKVLIMVGTDLTTERWFWRHEYPAALEQSVEMNEWLTKNAFTPQSLKRISRAKLRSHFAGSLNEKVKHLELPSTLVDFLLLKYL